MSLLRNLIWLTVTALVVAAAVLYQLTVPAGEAEDDARPVPPAAACQGQDPADVPGCEPAEEDADDADK